MWEKGRMKDRYWIDSDLPSWTGGGVSKDKAHSMIWASAHTKLFFLSFSPHLYLLVD